MVPPKHIAPSTRALAPHCLRTLTRKATRSLLQTLNHSSMQNFSPSLMAVPSDTTNTPTTVTSMRRGFTNEARQFDRRRGVFEVSEEYWLYLRVADWLNEEVCR